MFNVLSLERISVLRTPRTIFDSWILDGFDWVSVTYFSHEIIAATHAKIKVIEYTIYMILNRHWISTIENFSKAKKEEIMLVFNSREICFFRVQGKLGMQSDLMSL